MTAAVAPPGALQSVMLRWPVKTVLAHLVDAPVSAGPVPLRLPLLDLVAAALPDMTAHLTRRGLTRVGHPRWAITSGTVAGVDASLDELLVCWVDVAPTTRVHTPATTPVAVPVAVTS
jgi:hypothetical protein